MDDEKSQLYHVRITRKSDPNHDLTRLDIPQQELEERFLRPYREGHAIVIGGHAVAPHDLHHIRISRAEQPSALVIEQLKAEDRTSSFIFLTGPPYEWRVADRGVDVTDELITVPPGVETSSAVLPSMEGPVDKSTVWVVHGRNLKARDAMFDFLHTIGLKALEWNQAVQATGKPTPYVGEILDSAFNQAQAVVVLMTPDDEAKLRDSLQQPDDPPHEKKLTGQARPNVLFEAGMAMGRHVNRTVLVGLGTLRPFSDIGGRHVIRLDNSGQRRQELAYRLKTAGCPVDLTGTAWHTAGDFSIPEEVVEPEAQADEPKTQPRLEIVVGSGPTFRQEQRFVSGEGLPIQQILCRVGVRHDGFATVDNVSVELEDIAPPVLPPHLTLHQMHDNPPDNRFQQDFSLNVGQTKYIDVVLKRDEGAGLQAGDTVSRVAALRLAKATPNLFVFHIAPGVSQNIPAQRYEIVILAHGRNIAPARRNLTIDIDGSGALQLAPA
ncbi:MAG: nucleotide-binding protein [Dehalococcoidia bacterium]|jgi:predicted nucleotide-binding protein